MSSVPLQFARELEASLPVSNALDCREITAPIAIVERTAPTKVLLATTCHLASTARLAMAIAQAGGMVSAVYPASHPLDATRAPVQRIPYSALHPLQSLQSAIDRSEADIIVPCDERAVRHLHRLHANTPRAATRLLIERSLGDPASYGIATTRHDLLMLARSSAIAVPDSAPVSCLEDLHNLAAQRPFPWVIKADGSWAGLGVRVVASLAEAEAAYRQINRPVAASLVLREALVERDYFWAQPWLARSRPAISVQSFIAGRPANCAVACWRGEVLAATAVEVENAESETGPSTVVRVVENQQMLQAARGVVSALGMSGMVGFDFMIETATGTPYMIEMNPRNTPITHVRLGPGRDLVEALLARVSGRMPRERPPVTQQDLVVFFPHTWKHDPNSPFLNRGFHDVPWEEPALVRELVKPEMRERYWTMRTLRYLWLAARRLRTG
ncbi:MAG: ATP-grasp domain-containing protein [Acetobacteraceae bacterium]|nr:ATP-grasp domain-containing protein [Acetobacteraceae bacterium]